MDLSAKIIVTVVIILLLVITVLYYKKEDMTIVDLSTAGVDPNSFISYQINCAPEVLQMLTDCTFIEGVNLSTNIQSFVHNSHHGYMQFDGIWELTAQNTKYAGITQDAANPFKCVLLTSDYKSDGSVVNTSMGFADNSYVNTLQGFNNAFFNAQVGGFLRNLPATA